MKIFYSSVMSKFSNLSSKCSSSILKHFTPHLRQPKDELVECAIQPSPSLLRIVGILQQISELYLPNFWPFLDLTGSKDALITSKGHSELKFKK